ncbi:lipid-A-disaccharide synthase [Teredinibacter haidensis]|uniref:lipid-A-disaccharide synthase n=1 Tax=Teredinibacter haidensis TaxID=2731755 RepID=UPI00094896F1|nr:lipid-A-disaccharide synthase [Teredinibacter haidensis]
MSGQGSAASVSLRRVGIVVGEASGDILGAGLMSELQRRFPDCVFEGVGGPRMLAMGFRSLHNMERLAVMGLVEPLKRLPELLSIRKQLRVYFSENPPDIFIGIDAPDFNLTLEEKLRNAGVVTAHYVSPSVWAWRQGRVKKIARAVDLMLTLFPFEAQFYSEHDVTVACVGHTLADEIPLDIDQGAAQKKLKLPDAPALKTIALLPGSRAAEVAYLAETFFQAATICVQKNPQLRFLMAAANESRQHQIDDVLQAFPQLPVTLFLKQSHDVMAASDVVLMASGTTTLEALLLKKPMVIAYKMASLSWMILRRLVKSPFVGLPNLLAGRMLVPELLQDQATAENLADEILSYCDNAGKVAALQKDYLDIHLSLKKNADVAAANAICELLERKKNI